MIFKKIFKVFHLTDPRIYLAATWTVPSGATASLPTLSLATPLNARGVYRVSFTLL